MVILTPTFLLASRAGDTVLDESDRAAETLINAERRSLSHKSIVIE